MRNKMHNIFFKILVKGTNAEHQAIFLSAFVADTKMLYSDFQLYPFCAVWDGFWATKIFQKYLSLNLAASWLNPINPP